MASHPLAVVEQLFQSAADLPPHERPAWLDRQCGADRALRQLVQSLLDQHDGTTIGMLQSVGRSPGFTEIPSEGRIGAYRLLKVLGEGGCGTVFLAHQEAPIRRDVALKVIKPGMDTRQVIARFGAERQTLALMDHPNVARVLDAGTTRSGRPFFVMEYVPGQAINTYCDANLLGITERLHLFLQVCEAVQHAHQKGIIHRDIKPSNVLVQEVDGRPIPKVIDFGIAKAITGNPSDATPHTEQGQLLGTPAYMSPEQADPSSPGADTRTDIYSLGVLLYELLSGAYPFGNTVLGRSPLHELRRCILEVEPPRPSSRLITPGADPARVARTRSTNAHALARRLRGDLDWITLRAMDKDPARRYATVQELAADVTRHLEHKPVLARAPGRLYLVRKFIRRHRGPVAAVLLLSLTLIVGLIGTSAGLASARRSERAAQRQAYKANLTAAHAAMQSRAGELAWRSLHEAPPSLRGWEWRFLVRLAGGEAVVRRLPTTVFGASAASDDGAWIAVAEPDRVRIWEVAGGALVGQLDSVGDGVRALAISHDRTLLLECGLNHATMWSLASRRPLWTRAGAVSLRPEPFMTDPPVVLLGSAGAAHLELLDARSGSTIRAFALPDGIALAPLRTPDGRRILFSDGAGWIIALDTASGQETWRHRGEWLHLSRNGARVAVSHTGADRWTVLDTDTGVEAYFFEAGTQAGFPFEGPDGRWGLVEGSRVSLVDRRHASTSRLHCSAPVALVSPISGSDQIVALSSDGSLWKWDWDISPAPFVVAPFPRSTGGAWIAPTNGRIATLEWGGVVLWDSHTGAQLWTRYLTRGPLSVALNDEASAVAAVTDDGKVFVLEGDSGRTRCVLDAPDSAVTCMAWSPGRNELLLGTRTGDLYRLQCDERARAQRICNVANAALERIAARPGALSVVVQHRNTFSLIDLRTGRAGPEHQLEDDVSITALAFSPDGESLYLCSDRPAVSRWDVEKSRVLSTYVGPTARLTSVCIHPDGTRIAAASTDRVYIWDPASTEELFTVEAPSGTLAISFTADGNTLLASGGLSAVTAYETEPPSCGFSARAAAGHVRATVDAVHTANVADDAIALVQSDSSLLPFDRDAAVALLRVRGDPPNSLNSRAWEIARDARRSQAEYQQGVRYARAALKTWPEDHDFLNTLGILQYRLGELEESLSTLAACEALCRAAGRDPHPADTAALTMVHHALNHPADARAALRRTRDLLENATFAADPDMQRLYSEARTLLDQSDQPQPF